MRSGAKSGRRTRRQGGTRRRVVPLSATPSAGPMIPRACIFWERPCSNSARNNGRAKPLSDASKPKKPTLIRGTRGFESGDGSLKNSCGTCGHNIAKRWLLVGGPSDSSGTEPCVRMGRTATRANASAWRGNAHAHHQKSNQEADNRRATPPHDSLLVESHLHVLKRARKFTADLCLRLEKGNAHGLQGVCASVLESSVPRGAGGWSPAGSRLRAPRRTDHESLRVDQRAARQSPWSGRGGEPNGRSATRGCVLGPARRLCIC